MATKKKAPVLNRVETQQEIRARIRPVLDRIQAITANAGGIISQGMYERLLGAEHAILEVTRKPNYVNHWLMLAETKIREHHAEVREHCACGVCKRARII